MFGKWHRAQCSKCTFNNEVQIPYSNSASLPNTCFTLRMAGLVSGNNLPLICVHNKHTRRELSNYTCLPSPGNFVCSKMSRCLAIFKLPSANCAISFIRTIGYLSFKLCNIFHSNFIQIIGYLSFKLCNIFHSNYAIFFICISLPAQEINALSALSRNSLPCPPSSLVKLVGLQGLIQRAFQKMRDL
jgi:hypothetical protein